MNWKAQALNAVREQAPVAVPFNPDTSLAGDLSDAIDAGKIAARDLDFAKSLLAGFRRYGSFTDKQRPHVARLAKPADAPAAAAPSPDAPLAELLKCALPELTAGDRDFAESLLAGFAKWGSFTDRQRPHAQRLARYNRSLQTPALPAAAPEVSPAVIASPAVVAPAPVSRETFPKVAALFGPGKFARFDGAEGLALRAKNDFSVVWVKAGSAVVGRLLSDGTYIPKYQNKEASEQLRALDADPVGYAKANGVLTGRCCCCGRALTDPASIEKGIGPICEARF